MPNYLSPDIYVEEISTGPRPIGAVTTTLPAFLGIAPKADAYPGQPRAVNNWSEFLREFAPPDPKDTSTDLSNAIFGFFQNAGSSSRCMVVNLGTDKTLREGLAALEAFDDVAMVAAPGYTDAVTYEALLSHCEKLKDRVAIMDAPREVPSIEGLTRVAEPKPAGTGRRGGGGGAAAAADENAGFRPRQSDGGYGAYYFPWILIEDPLSSTAKQVFVAPSGHMAGVWARTDTDRGVHKAPANVPILGALNLSHRVTRAEQELLNPAGVNCIRWFPTEGIRVWGARTIAAQASEWRYLSVRRLFNMIEESIAKGTRWVVFEPNDRPLWFEIKRDVSAFLRTLWRDGALMGRTAEQAFFVQCDEETNPPDSIDQGRVVIVIGIAPVKPAEFIIFRIGQHSGGVEIEA